LARKLERELGVQLFEESAQVSAAPKAAGKKEITLGDILEIERKRKK